MKFSRKYKVLYHDTDINGVLYPSRLFMYLQETAHGHTVEVGSPPEVMIERDGGCFWLTRMCVSIIKAIHFDDELEVTTWATDDSRGFSFNRCFQILRGDEVVCEAYSVWVLMNRTTMRPTLVKDWPVDIGPEAPIKPSAPLHTRIPREIVLEQGNGEHTVTYPDIDYNGHMNNAKYPDIICGFLPIDILKGKRISELTISYLHEAAACETIRAEYGRDSEEDGVYYVRTRRLSDNEVNVEARIKLSEDI